MHLNTILFSLIILWNKHQLFQYFPQRRQKDIIVKGKGVGKMDFNPDSAIYLVQIASLPCNEWYPFSGQPQWHGLPPHCHQSPTLMVLVVWQALNSTYKTLFTPLISTSDPDLTSFPLDSITSVWGTKLNLSFMLNPPPKGEKICMIWLVKRKWKMICWQTLKEDR